MHGEFVARFQGIARKHRVWLILGYHDYSEGRNRLMFMGPDGSELGEYEKTHLTPFEDYKPGSGETVMIRLDDIGIGGMICQDDNFTDLSRAYGRQGAGVVAVPTFDWEMVKDAHLQNSLHRPIESCYAIVRAAMDGISAIVSPTGEVLARRDHFEEGPGVIMADVPILARATPFSRWGHWPVVPCLGFAVGCAAWVLRARRSRPTEGISATRQVV